MSISFKVEGFDEATKTLESLARSISTDLVTLGENILKTAKQICNDPDCKKLKRKKIEYNSTSGKFIMDIDIIDPVGIDCLIQAIRQILPTMTDVQKQIFEQEVKRLEQQKKDLNQQS